MKKARGSHREDREGRSERWVGSSHTLMGAGRYWDTVAIPQGACSLDILWTY